MTDTAPATTETPAPDLAGTFAVYLLPDGSAGLVLDIGISGLGATGVARHHVPKFVVDMVIYGKRPTPKTLFQMMRGGDSGSVGDLDETDGAQSSPEAGTGEILPGDHP